MPLIEGERFTDFLDAFGTPQSPELVDLISSLNSIADTPTAASLVEQYAGGISHLREKVCTLLWILLRDTREVRYSCGIILELIVACLNDRSGEDYYGVRSQTDGESIRDINEFVVGCLREWELEPIRYCATMIRCACRDDSSTANLLQYVKSGGVRASIALNALYKFPGSSACEALIEIWEWTPDWKVKSDVGWALLLRGDDRGVDFIRERFAATERTSPAWIGLVLSIAMAGDPEGRMILQQISGSDASSMEHLHLRRFLTGRWSRQLLQEEYWKGLLTASDAAVLKRGPLSGSTPAFFNLLPTDPRFPPPWVIG